LLRQNENFSITKLLSHCDFFWARFHRGLIVDYLNGSNKIKFNLNQRINTIALKFYSNIELDSKFEFILIKMILNVKKNFIHMPHAAFG